MQHIQLNIGQYEKLSLYMNNKYVGMFFRVSLVEWTTIDRTYESERLQETASLFVRDRDDNNVFAASVGDGRKYTIRYNNDGVLNDTELYIEEA